MNKWILLAFTLMGIVMVTVLSAGTQYDLLIKNVTVIDVQSGKAVYGKDVYIKDDRIVKVADASKTQEQVADVIDGTGRFLVPGFWDMHTHNWWNIHFSNYYVANGVLGVRNMYTPMSMIQPLKDSINNNLIAGPEYVAAGRVLEGANPEFPDWLVVDSAGKIAAALDTLQLEGSDFVKIYNKVPREVYFDLVKEAAKRGMPVEGHLPMAVTALEASDAGQRSFEHLLGLPDLCTSDTLFKNKYNYNWFAAVMKEDDYGTVLLDSQLAAVNFAVLKKNNTYVCPTLVVWYNYFHPDLFVENDSLLQKFPQEIVDYWQGEILKYREKDESYKQMALRKYETFKKVTYLLYQAGVPLISGTDVINPFVYPGYSLHREFELLSECGIPAAEILRMSTIHAASFLNLPDYGQVKEGYRASLVLLDENPLADIKNTRKINAVILKGKALDRTALLKMKE